jgi:hypothetical protein
MNERADPTFWMTNATNSHDRRHEFLERAAERIFLRRS